MSIRRKASIARNTSIARKASVATTTALLALAGPEVAHACAVCFGAADAPMTHGLNNGILVLLGFVAVVQGGFVALFVSIRRRARQVRERKESFEIIDGGLPSLASAARPAGGTRPDGTSRTTSNEGRS